MDATNYILTQLDTDEKVWWTTTIKEHRQRLITEPRLYAEKILEKSWNDKKTMLKNLDQVIKSTREKIWQLYLIDEANFHREVLTYLFTQRKLPTEILHNITDHKLLRSLDDLSLTTELGKLTGDYTGRIMPYIYELALSTTQSRRSRAGNTFEQLIESLMKNFDISFDTQGSVSSKIYSSLGLGKKVDAIVPNIDAYDKNRSKCAIVTMKTTLRERWQEVAEELSRTNIPHIYLLTADESITVNVIDTMKNYNISLVVYNSEKTSKFTGQDNVYSFHDFFTKEMPFIMRYWGE